MVGILCHSRVLAPRTAQDGGSRTKSGLQNMALVVVDAREVMGIDGSEVKVRFGGFGKIPADYATINEGRGNAQ